MTTIASSLKMMAGDTFNSITGGGYYAAKIERVGTTLVGCAGPVSWCRQFIAWRRDGGKHPRFSMDHPFEAMVLDRTGLYVFYSDCVPDRVAGKCHAIGTGKQYALGAMHHGATPDQAVDTACKFDPYSKPPIQREKL